MKKIPLGNNKYTMVDDTDYDWLNQYMWCVGAGGYVINALSRTRLCDIPFSPILQIHRLILGLKHGDKRQADHINHNTLDNRRNNLRICSHAENQHNRSYTKKNTSSRFKGVYWHKQGKKWAARIKINGAKKHLGCFSKEEYAAHAYNLAAKRYYGEFAFLNKIY